MTTHTIEVTAIEEDLLPRLNLRAFQQGQDRSVCIRDLLRRALDEEEITEFINAQVHEARRERRAEKLHWKPRIKRPREHCSRPTSAAGSRLSYTWTEGG